MKTREEDRLLGVGRLAPNPAWSLKAHFHPFHELIVVLRGKIHVEICGRSLTAGPGEALFYRAGNAHAERSDPDDPVETLFISFYHAACTPRQSSVVRDVRGRIAVLISWLYHDQFTATEAQTALTAHYFQSLIREMIRASDEKSSSDLVGKMRAWMRERLDEPLTLDAMAAYAAMDKYRFIRRFKKSAGRTPARELRSLRLEKARSLLLTTDLPLKAIAPQTGLGDAYRLSKLFRKEFGMPPGFMRKIVEERDD